MGHVHYIQHDRAPVHAALSRNVSSLRAQAIATVEKRKMMPSRCTIGRDSPCVKAKTKILASLQLFSIRDSLPPPQSENRQFYGQLSAFSRPDSRFGTTQQSAIAKKLQFEPFFCFRAPGAASGRRHRQGGYFGRRHGQGGFFGGTMGGNPSAASRGSLDAAS